MSRIVAVTAVLSAELTANGNSERAEELRCELAELEAAEGRRLRADKAFAKQQEQLREVASGNPVAVRQSIAEWQGAHRKFLRRCEVRPVGARRRGAPERRPGRSASTRTSRSSKSGGDPPKPGDDGPGGRLSQPPAGVAPPRGNLEVLARIVWAREALQLGDYGDAEAVLADLEDELRIEAAA